MTRLAPPSNLRNGLKWRDGRPRWEPSPANRTCGFPGVDLRDHAGEWMDRGAATSAADARTLWARIVREALRDDDAGGQARVQLRQALDRLPPMPAEAEPRRRRELVADLIERGRAVLEDREPGVTQAFAHAPRSVNAMVDGYFADTEAMARISAETQRVYRVQSKKLKARFGPRRADEVTPPQLRQWYLDLCDEISVATANLALGAAAAIFRWAVWQDPAWMAVSPAEKLGRQQAEGRLVFWTVAEETAFVTWCDANGYIDVADAVTACLWTGARQIDVAAAGLSALESQTWRFVPQKTRRKGQEALPGILPPLRRRIERRRAEADASPVRHLNDPPFLWSSAGRRHTSASIGERFRLARAEAVAAKAMPAAFMDKRLQDTRDTCVTRLYDAGASLDRIASWGGWSADSAGKILRQHYLTLLEGGALETAAKLEAWAERQGLDMTAA